MSQNKTPGRELQLFKQPTTRAHKIQRYQNMTYFANVSREKMRSLFARYARQNGRFSSVRDVFSLPFLLLFIISGRENERDEKLLETALIVAVYQEETSCSLSNNSETRVCVILVRYHVETCTQESRRRKGEGEREREKNINNSKKATFAKKLSETSRLLSRINEKADTGSRILRGKTLAFIARCTSESTDMYTERYHKREMGGSFLSPSPSLPPTWNYI